MKEENGNLLTDSNRTDKLKNYFSRLCNKYKTD